MSAKVDAVYLGIHAALLADGAFAAVVATRVFDTIAPASTAYPFVTIDSPTSRDFRAFGNPGEDDSFAIHLWARDDKANKGRPTSMKQVNELYGLVEAVLNQTRLTISGVTHIVGRTTLLTNALDADGVTRHGVVRYTCQAFA